MFKARLSNNKFASETSKKYIHAMQWMCGETSGSKWEIITDYWQLLLLQVITEHPRLSQRTTSTKMVFLRNQQYWLYTKQWKGTYTLKNVRPVSGAYADMRDRCHGLTFLKKHIVFNRIPLHRENNISHTCWKVS